METSWTMWLRKKKQKKKQSVDLTLSTLNIVELWEEKGYWNKQHSKKKGAKNNSKKAAFISLFFPTIFIFYIFSTTTNRKAHSECVHWATLSASFDVLIVAASEVPYAEFL